MDKVMSKIKIGVQVTAKVRPTKVAVSGTFQGYELQDNEDPASVCGKVFYVKDGMQRLDFVYVDSINVCDIKDERIKNLIYCIVRDRSDVGKLLEANGCPVEKALSWIEKQKEQKPVKLNDDTEVGLDRALQIVKHAKGNLCCYQSDDGIYECDHAIQTLESILKNGIEQKPVHTAKEMWKEMRLEVYAQASGNRHEPNYSDDSTKMFSLCDIDEIFEKIGDSTVGSQPAEWSKEDESYLQTVINEMEANKKEAREYEHKKYDTIIIWLKSLRSRPKSSGNWKPSEEQIKAMEEVRTIFHHHHLWDEINPILYDYEELMRDLYKLM